MYVLYVHTTYTHTTHTNVPLSCTEPGLQNLCTLWTVERDSGTSVSPSDRTFKLYCIVRLCYGRSIFFCSACACKLVKSTSIVSKIKSRNTFVKENYLLIAKNIALFFLVLLINNVVYVETTCIVGTTVPVLSKLIGKLTKCLIIIRQ